MFLFKSIMPCLGLAEMIKNGDFESGSSDWKTQSGTNLQIIADENSPTGSHYALLSQRGESWHGLYQDIELEPADGGSILTTSFYSKINPNQVDASTWDPWKVKSLTGKLKLRFRQNGENKVEYASCVASCIGKL